MIQYGYSYIIKQWININDIQLDYDEAVDYDLFFFNNDYPFELVLTLYF